jgi:N-acetylglucosaminyl-diphospho-decaprenol L-rhamnosyltransferase
VDKFPSRERSTAATLEPRVTAIVVVHNMYDGAPGQTPLDLCLRSAMAEPWIDDLVVVDHANAPEISRALRGMQMDRRDLKVVTADPGSNPASAANLGAVEARGRWLLFLAPDVVLQRGAVARMAAAGGNASAPWIVGGRLTDTEGRERRAARAGALNTFSAIALAMNLPGKKPGKRGKADEATRVGAVSGAFMLIPRSDFQTLNGFDEGFDTDYADLDLCRRAAEAGGSILFQPHAAGVQFDRTRPRGGKPAQGLARFAERSAKTPLEKTFAMMAMPTLATLVWLRDFIAGRPPVRR